MCSGQPEDKPVEVSEDSLSLSELMMIRVERKESSIRGGGRDAFLNIKKKQEIGAKWHIKNNRANVIHRICTIESGASKVLQNL